MTYYVSYWMDETETAISAEELAIRLAEAQQTGRELVLTSITTTEMHFTEFEIEG